MTLQPDPHPWLPPEEPDLTRLAFEAADAEGLAELRCWPVVEKGGLALPGLPAFLCWRWQNHLLLLQARELGALVPGAKPHGLDPGWLEALDPREVARPFTRHPDFGGAVGLHLVQVVAPGRARVRSSAAPPAGLIPAVLERLTGLPAWDFA